MLFRNYSNRDKVRIIVLYLMHRDGAPEEDLRRLFQHAKLQLSEQDAIKGLAHLGIRLYRVSARSLRWGSSSLVYLQFLPIRARATETLAKSNLNPSSLTTTMN